MHYPTYRQSLILLGIWLLITAVTVVAIIMPFFSIEDGTGLLITYSLSMILTIVCAFLMRKNWQLPTTPFHFNIILFSFIAIISVQLFLEPFRNLLPMSDGLIKMMKGMKNQPYPFFLMAVIAAPVLEEILFRGIILNGFLKNYKPLPAILASSFLFGLIHGNLPQGINAFVLGILFGWIYWKTESILSVILLHALNNALAFFGALSLSEPTLKSTYELVNNDILYALLYTTATGFALLSIWILHTKYFHPKSEKTDYEELPAEIKG